MSDSQQGQIVETHVLDTIDPKILGERLAAARHARRHTQQQAANELGVSRATITAIEKGRRRPRPSELVKLARLYGQPVNSFVRAEADSSDLTFDDEVLAVQAYVAGLLSEGQLAERLGTDRIGARERVLAITGGTQQDEEGG